jgi:hypothetical protein
MKDPPQDSDDDLTALNQLYNLSAGMELPAQIPVSAAMTIIASETIVKTDKLDNAIKALNNDRTKYSVKLLEDIVDNEKFALSSLINTNDWKISENAFVDYLTMNVNQNGFNGKVFDLSDSDRNLLFNYLKQLL